MNHAPPPSLHGPRERLLRVAHPRDYDEWLDRAEVERVSAHLLRPYDGSDLVVYAANPRVGNVRNQNVDLLDSQ
jgi:putative SOS response-associated peptidase YedK